MVLTDHRGQWEMRPSMYIEGRTNQVLFKLFKSPVVCPIV